MINAFVMRKYAALITSSMTSTILFFVGVMYWGLLWGIVFLIVGLILGVVIGNILLNNPFTSMLEGKGLLVINMDSTGILKPFIVGLESPYIKGRFNGKWIEDVFNRNTINQLAEPKIAKKAVIQNETGLTINLTEEEYNKARFSMFHYPVIIWNDQVKSILTKDFLAKNEKDTFAEHNILYLNNKVRELTNSVRDFGRHVVENMKPSKGIFSNPVIVGIIIFFVGLLIIMFAPALFKTIGGTMSNSPLGSVGAGVMNNAAITPRG